MKDAIVIGGGITGLIAAWRLKSAGFDVAVIEEHTPGGLIKTEKKDGFTLECGPNVVLDKPSLLQVVKGVGLADKIVYPKYRLYRQHIWHEGHPERIPKDPVSFIKSPFFDSESKKKIFPKLLFGKVPNPGLDDCSVSDFFRPVVGEQAVKNMLGPALSGIYGQSPDSLSAKMVFPGLFEAAKAGKSFIQYMKKRRAEVGRTKVFVLRDGLSSLVDALVKALGEKTILQGRVSSVRKENGTFTVSFASGQSLSARRVIVATSGGASAGFLGELLPALSQKLSAVRYVPLTVAHFAVPSTAPVLEKSFGMLIPRTAGYKILGVMFNSILFPHVAPEGKHLVTIMLGGEGREDVTGLDDAAVNEAVRKELATLLGISELQPLNIQRWQKAIPVYPVGYHSLVEEMRAAESAFPGLHFAGTDTGQPGIADRAGAFSVPVRKDTEKQKGILVCQVGTPDSPSVPDVKRYLKQFLSDPAIVSLPRWFWLPLLNTVILPFRSTKSAEKYRKIWLKEGSPLKIYSERQAEAIRQSAGVPVELGMNYGSPSIGSALDKLSAAGCNEIEVFSLYPHAAGATSGSFIETARRWKEGRAREYKASPALNLASSFCENSLWLNTQAEHINSFLKSLAQRPEKLLLSYHGIPKKSVEAGDTYAKACLKSTEDLKALLKIEEADVVHCYHSRFGSAEWTRPYTEDLLRDLAKQGIKRIAVACPGFTCDCLETLYDVGILFKDKFKAAGGETLDYIPALNDKPQWLEALSQVASGK